MNLESDSSPKKKSPSNDFELEEFDFKPITSGLGFSHQQKTTTDIKPAFERQAQVREVSIPQPVKALPRKEMNVYQNDLSIFYGQSEQGKASVPPEEKIEKVFRIAPKADRVVAYVIDLSILLSVLSVTLVFKAQAMGMDLMEAWSQYPNEVTPLVVTLFCGFYLLYFSISEKSGATIGKSMMDIRVVDMENLPQNFTMLVVRTLITLVNFASLGLFSYFDLQNKATGSKVIKAN